MRKNIKHPSHTLRRVFAALLALFMTLTPVAPALAGAQDPVTGAFRGNVSNSQTGAPIAGAVVQFINTVTEVPVAKRTDALSLRTLRSVGSTPEELRAEWRNETPPGA